MKRYWKACLIILGSMIAVMTLVPATAQAQPYAGDNYGPYTQPNGVCRSKVYGLSKVLEATAPSPTVYARNNHAGPNNDSAWIRFRVFLVNAATGGTVQASGYSSWVLATDVTPARWAGSTMFSASPNLQYVIDTRIEFWNSTNQTGWVADRIPRYQLIDRYQRNYGLHPYCAYVAA